MTLNERQHVFGRRLGSDHVGTADVDRRTEEHVELRAVIER